MTPLALALRGAANAGLKIRLTASPAGAVRVVAVRHAKRRRWGYADASQLLPDGFDAGELAVAVATVTAVLRERTRLGLGS